MFAPLVFRISRMNGVFLGRKGTDQLGICIPLFAAFTKTATGGGGKLQQQSFTVSYLVNSCGFSLKSAQYISERVHFKTPDRPDSVLNLFRQEHGFTQAALTKVIMNQPLILSMDAAKILRPKLEFFRSMGFSSADIIKLMSKNPNLLRRSLHNFIVPNYNVVTTVIDPLDTAKLVSAFGGHRYYQISFKNAYTNIELLRENHVPRSSLSLMFCHFSRLVHLHPPKFTEILEEVLQMGFNPYKSVFILAMDVRAFHKGRWESRIKVYGRWGWSRDDTISAFTKHPHCMTLSDMKINKKMEFLVKQMGVPSRDLARCPTILLLSFEKRIFPRCSLIQMLQLRELVKKKFNLSYALSVMEELFVKRFLTPHQERVPELLSMYKAKTEKI